MTTEIYEGRETVYYAGCDECDWYGESYIDESDAERERKWHAERCDGDEDPRDERQKWQDTLDEAAGEAA